MVVLFSKYDFPVLYKFGWSQLVVDPCHNFQTPLKPQGSQIKPWMSIFFWLNPNGYKKSMMYFFWKFSSNYFQDWKWKLAFKAFPFTFINNNWYMKGPDQILWHCLTIDQIPTIMQEMHQGVGGGHFSTTIISCKILDAQYWWHKTLYKDGVLAILWWLSTYLKSCTLSFGKTNNFLTIEPFIK